MMSLHDKLCTWVQVHHLYQPERNQLVDAYLRYHITHCAACQIEIESIQTLGASIADLSLDVPAVPDDTSWARLSAALPPRDNNPVNAEASLFERPRRLISWGTVAAAVGCTGLVFASVLIKANLNVAQTVTHPETRTAKQDLSTDAETALSPSNPDNALTATREQAKLVASVDSSVNDPFETKSSKTKNPPELPRVFGSSRTNTASGKKPLIVASERVVDDPSVSMQDSLSSDARLDIAAQPHQTSSQIAMRAAVPTVQSDQQFGTPATSQNGGFSVTPATYSPSAGMELTESQNRLRSLLQ